MRWAIIFTALALAGCAQYGGLAAAVRVNGAQVADGQRDVAQYTLCSAITVGAWVREFGEDADRARAWKTLCSKKSTETPGKNK